MLEGAEPRGQSRGAATLPATEAAGRQLRVSVLQVATAIISAAGALMGLRSGATMVKEAVSEFSADRGLTEAAALAYYGALSLAPLLLILMWVMSVFGPDAQRVVIDQGIAIVGDQAGGAFETVIAKFAGATQCRQAVRLDRPGRADVLGRQRFRAAPAVA
jgi:hypothetical protein